MHPGHEGGKLEYKSVITKKRIASGILWGGGGGEILGRQTRRETKDAMLLHKTEGDLDRDFKSREKKHQGTCLRETKCKLKKKIPKKAELKRGGGTH